jgi:FtsH-binding integral membrane protein
MKKIYWLTLLGILLGALAGYSYYFYVGCSAGTCLITSKPLNSTLYGALLGGLFVNSFSPSTPKGIQ